MGIKLFSLLKMLNYVVIFIDKMIKIDCKNNIWRFLSINNAYFKIIFIWNK